MSERPMEEVAALFNEAYVELTALRRDLLDAVRSGADASDPAVRALVERAAAMTAAIGGAKATPTAAPVVPSADAELRALRAVVLRPPLDGHLLMAAFRAQPRAQAFPLIADALESANGTRREVWEARMVVDVLSAPRGMGLPAARRTAGELGLDGYAAIADLDDSDLARLVAGLRAAA